MNPKFPVLCIPGIIARPDSRDSYPNIWGNILETRVDKNICKIKKQQPFFGLVLSRGNVFREEVRPIFQVADLTI